VGAYAAPAPYQDDIAEQRCFQGHGVKSRHVNMVVYPPKDSHARSSLSGHARPARRQKRSWDLRLGDETWLHAATA
jgi:hypothetical protein